MSSAATSSGSATRAQRRGDAHRLCATLADLLAEALRVGDEEAAKQYRQDLERVERVARETPVAAEGSGKTRDMTPG